MGDNSYMLWVESFCGHLAILYAAYIVLKKELVIVLLYFCICSSVIYMRNLVDVELIVDFKPISGCQFF